MSAQRLPLPHNARVRVGLIMMIFFAVVAAAGPSIVSALGHSATALHDGPPMVGPSSEHWLGTTSAGEDVFAQLVVGTRTSLLVGIVAGLIGTVIAVVFGIASTFGGRWLNGPLRVAINVFLVIPSLPLLIIVAAYAKGKGGWEVVALIIGLTSWAGGARQKAAQSLSLRGRDFVLSADMAGESRWRIITTEIAPHLAPLVSATFLFSVVGAIVAEAGLDFIGTGDISNVSWGTMLYWANTHGAIADGAWWWFVPPGVCIALMGAAAGLINFGSDEIADPRRRARSESPVTVVNAPAGALTAKDVAMPEPGR